MSNVDLAIIEKIIDDVIKIRKNKIAELSKFEVVLTGLNSVTETVSGILNETDFSISELSDVKNSLADFNSQNFPQKITEIKSKIAEYKNFYGKDTINIGVAGIARSGKSTFLQTVSGLNKDVIPTSDGGFCTGAKSIIYHHEGEPYAEVEFYSGEEFMREAVKKALKEIGIEVNIPVTLEEFEKNPLPNCPEENKAKKMQLYNKLKAMHNNFGAFKKYINGAVEKIPINKVIDFVAKTNNEGQEIHQYNAVKTVRIYTPFQTAKIKKLALIDLPGLDEIAPSIKERLVESLKNEIDIILIIRKPDSGGDDWRDNDYGIFELLSDHIEIEKIFMVLNTLDNGANLKQVNEMKKKAEDQQKDKNNKRAIVYNQLFTASCKSRDEIDEKTLIPVLKFLENNILRLDAKQIGELEKKYNELLNQFKELINKMKRESSLDSEEYSDKAAYEFDKLFKDFMIKLRTNLQIFLKKQHKICNDDTSEFVQEFKTVIAKICIEAKDECIMAIPSIEEIENGMAAAKGKDTYIEEQFVEMRLKFTKVMRNIDDHLNRLINSKLVQIIEQMKSTEPLKKFFEYHISDPANISATEQLKIIVKVIKNLTTDNFQSIIHVFNKLINFNFSYDSHLHYIVREKMKLFDTYDKVEYRSEEIKTSEDVNELLAERIKQTSFDVKQAMDNLNLYPSKSLYALAEDFVDIIARDSKIEDELNILMRKVKYIFWPEKYKTIKTVAEIRRKIDVSVIAPAERYL